MAHSVLVVAESGSGKSTSGRNLNPKETFWINVANKPLPFKGWKNMYIPVTKEDPTGGNLSKASSPMSIMMMLDIIDKQMPHIKNIVLDDWQYMSAFEFFDRADEKGYEKFTDIGKGLVQVAKKPIGMRDDLTIFFLTHVEENQDQRGKRKQKAKTIGELFACVLSNCGNILKLITTNYRWQHTIGLTVTCSGIVKRLLDMWTIRIQASLMDEGSTTIPEGSTL